MFSDGLQVSSKGLPASTKCLTSLPMCEGTQCFFHSRIQQLHACKASERRAGVLLLSAYSVDSRWVGTPQKHVLSVDPTGHPSKANANFFLSLLLGCLTDAYTCHTPHLEAEEGIVQASFGLASGVARCFTHPQSTFAPSLLLHLSLLYWNIIFFHTG